MGLLQQAVKTYEFLESQGMVGKYEAEKEPLAPIGHKIAPAKIEITLDANGKFITAQNVNEKIIIPVTEESANRTSKSASKNPHPLCDKLTYLSGNDENKFTLYTEQLQKWVESEYGDPVLEAVLNYVKGKTVVKDLVNAGIVKCDEKGCVKNEEDIICWKVGDIRLCEGEILKKYEMYYLSEKSSDFCICYVTGKKTMSASRHLKGVVSYSGNAKLISANDNTNFTYRGRFTESEQAVSVGYNVSQKAHNALRWLLSNEGYSKNNRRFICWCPSGKKLPKPQDSFLHRGGDKYKWVDYQNDLQKMLESYKTNLTDMDDVVIASFEAATNGRLSVTYYNELKGSDFLERLKYWDETCCWYDNRWGVSAPSLYSIVEYAFGNQRGSDENSNMEADENIIGQNMQRLIRCRVDKEKIPRDIVKNMVNKAERLHLYNKKNRDKLLFTACAVIRKYLIDHKKEECEMALETEKKDRSYQYGRLLAVLEKIEIAAYGKDKAGITNALRMQSMFVKRPLKTTDILLSQLKNVCYPKLTVASRVFFDRIIGQIMEVISQTGGDILNKPLSETYLIGYYLQKNSLDNYSKDNADLEESEEE